MNDNVIVNNIINLNKKIINNIIFSWIPEHCGLSSNERVNILAKEKNK